MNAFMPLQSLVYGLGVLGGKAKKGLSGIWDKWQDTQEQRDAITEGHAAQGRQGRWSDPKQFSTLGELGALQKLAEPRDSLPGLLNTQKLGKVGGKRNLRPITLQGLLGG